MPMQDQAVPVPPTAAPCCAPLVREPITEDWAGDLARMFKALGDPVRLRLLSLVASSAGAEACVCDLTAPFSLSQPTISHHLKVLREAGLLECERRGTWVWYRVVPAGLAQLAAVLGPAELSADDAATTASAAPTCGAPVTA
jgi:ArsR family transcriptional regulator